MAKYSSKLLENVADWLAESSSFTSRVVGEHKGLWKKIYKLLHLVRRNTL